MSSDRWRRLEDLFEEALRLPPLERGPFLERFCGNDVDLRQRVESLLRHSDGSDDFIRGPIEEAEASIGVRPATSAGTVIGNYRLEREIGRGGMGEVWLASQTEPVRRKVALKLIKRGMDSEQVVARFDIERQALARMDHPSTARVFDAGTSDDGRPYFVMEYVEGLSIIEHCDSHQASVRERLELFVQVCEAVHHAHQKGILHRDLKPSNVLVAVHEGRAFPKIIDFGIAKALDEQLGGGVTALTGRFLVGTPEYMSPEQAELGRRDVDTRSDVYSLGVMLYELLVGVLPLDSGLLREGSFDEIRQAVRDQDPPTPSTRLSRLEEVEATVDRRGTDLRTLKRALRGDLDWITMMALEKDRERRYDSAMALADDLRHYLRDEPVSAGPPGAMYVAGKFVRRHRVAVAAAAVAAVAIPLVSALFVWQQSERASEEARLRRAARRQLYNADMKLASQAFDEGRIGRLEELLEEHAPRPGEEDLRQFEWFHWRRAARLSRVLPPPTHKNLLGLEASSDGRLVALSSSDFFFLYDAASQEVEHTLDASKSMRPFTPDASAFSADGRFFAVAGPAGLELWDTLAAEAGGELTSAMPLLTAQSPAAADGGGGAGSSRAGTPRMSAVAFAPDGRLLAIGTDRGRVEIRDRETAALELSIEVGAGVRGLAFDGGGSRLFVATTVAGDALFAYDTATGRALAKAAPDDRGLAALAYSAQAGLLATAGREDAVRLWNEDLEPLATVPAPGYPSTLAFSPGGRRLAAGTMGTNVVLVWDVESLERLATLRGHPDSLSGVEFVGDEGTIWSISRAAVRVWDVDRAQPFASFHAPSLAFSDVEPRPLALQTYPSHDLAFSGDGHLLYAVGDGGAVRSWRLESGEWRPRPPPPEELERVVLAEDGSAIAGARSDGRLLVWRPDTREVLFDEALSSASRLESVDRDGERVALVGEEGSELTVRHLPGDGSGAVLSDRSRPAGFSPDGESLILVRPDSKAELWDVSADPARMKWSAGGEEVVGRLRAPYSGPSMSFAFSADGARVAIGYDSDILLRDAQTGRLEQVLKGHRSWVRSLAFSPDGQSLVSGAVDGEVRIWSTDTGDERSLLGSHVGSVEAIAFSPLGDAVASLSTDGELRIWLTESH
jgi:serine/threonine protein kinase/WD40 repeat protein